MSIPQDVTESFGLMSMPMVAMNSELGRSRQGSADRESAEDAAGTTRPLTLPLQSIPRSTLKFLSEPVKHLRPVLLHLVRKKKAIWIYAIISGAQASVAIVGKCRQRDCGLQDCS